MLCCDWTAGLQSLPFRLYFLNFCLEYIFFHIPVSPGKGTQYMKHHIFNMLSGKSYGLHDTAVSPRDMFRILDLLVFRISCLLLWRVLYLPPAGILFFHVRYERHTTMPEVRDPPWICWPGRFLSALYPAIACRKRLCRLHSVW